MNRCAISIKSKIAQFTFRGETKPKSAEIIKNISLIYISKGDNQQAVKYIQEARLENPDDLDLLFSEANAKLKLNNKQAFKDLMIEATVILKILNYNTIWVSSLPNQVIIN